MKLKNIIYYKLELKKKLTKKINDKYYKLK